MIYFDDFLIDDPSDELPVVDQTSEPVEEQPSEPVEEQPSDDLAGEDSGDESVRAQYDGDISDSVLSKLGAYYNAHAKLTDSYSIYRPSQYNYILVYGDSDDGRSFSNPTVVSLVYSTYSSSGSTLTISHPSSYIIDSSWSGYVYSSSSSFIPNHYILDSPRYLTSSLFFLTVVIFIVFLSRFIYSIIKKR